MIRKYEACETCEDQKFHKEERAKGLSDEKFFEICCNCDGRSDKKQPERVSIHSPEQEEGTIDDEDEVIDEQEVTEEE